jgi:ketosteroid isomerase-like protein
MTTTHTLTDRYRAAVEGGDLAELVELYDPDVLLDAHVPNWRFQVTGRTEVARFTGSALPTPGRFTVFEVDATVDGDLLVQFQWRQQTDDGPGATARQLHRLRLDDGRIVEQTVFCAGVWNRQHQERMAAEAPLARP